MVPAPLSLYVHIPFCSLKCSYCDFNSYAGMESLVSPFVEALLAETSLWGGTSGAPSVATVYFGGGTPTLLRAAQNARVLDCIRRSFSLRADAEVTIEANPGTVTIDGLRELAGAGFNRISFGVQSFRDADLAALDRTHTAREATESYRLAREAGFANVSLDLIYGLPGQAMDAWRANVDRAVALGPDHLSLYALTVEEGTRLAYDIDHGRVDAPDADLQADMYEWACDRLADAGYRQYEISNWARPGRECRHNLVYWRNGEWLGLGPGAHSHWAGFRFANVYSPRRYIDLLSGVPNHGGSDATPAAVIGSLGHLAFVEPQPEALRLADTAILALRLNEGLDIRGFEKRFDRRVEDVYGQPIAEMVAAGLLERADGRLYLTPRGRLLANEVFSRLLPD